MHVITCNGEGLVPVTSSFMVLDTCSWLVSSLVDDIMIVVKEEGNEYSLLWWLKEIERFSPSMYMTLYLHVYVHLFIDTDAYLLTLALLTLTLVHTLFFASQSLHAWSDCL